MIDMLLSAAVPWGAVVGLHGYIAVRQVPLLEQKIRVLRGLVLQYGFALGLLIAAIVVHARQAPRLPTGEGAELLELKAYLVLLKNHEAQAFWQLMAIPFLLLTVLPTVWHVLGHAGSFILAHRTDLVGRDQAAQWSGDDKRPAAGKPAREQVDG